MSWLDILGSVFNVSSAAAGASSGGGGGLSGLAGILGPITGASTPSASSAGTNALLMALGGLASKYKATPLAGATEDEIKRANRENLIAGALGALMTGYGQYSQEQAKQQALGGLADILAKGAQTPQGPVQPGQTMAPVPMSQQIAQWTQQNPQMAELGIKAIETAQANETKQALEALKAQQRAEQIAYNRRLDEAKLAMGYTQGLGSVQAGERAAANALLGLQAQGIELPEGQLSEAAKVLTSPRPSAEQGRALAQKALGTQSKQEINFTVPPQTADKISPALEALYAGEFNKMISDPKTGEMRRAVDIVNDQFPANISQRISEFTGEAPVGTTESTPLSPGTQAGDLVEAIQAGTKSKKATAKRTEYVKAYDRFAKPVSDIIANGYKADNFKNEINGLLDDGTYSSTRSAFKMFEKSLDDSVVREGELRDVIAASVPKFIQLQQTITGLLGKKQDIPESLKQDLRTATETIATIRRQAGQDAETAVNKATKSFIDENNLGVSVLDYMPKQTRIKDLMRQGQGAGALGTPIGIPSPTPTPTARTITRIEEL